MSFQEYIADVIMPHRRGILGTVIFHLVVGIFLVSMELRKVNTHSELEIVFEVPAPEEKQKQEEEEVRKEDLRQKSATEEVERMLRSIAVNENVKEKNREARVQEYVDEVLDELRENDGDGRYKAQKDKNFRKDSLQHARDRKEQELDSLKSVFYSGESSVSYNLKDRYARFLPIPVFKCEVGGKVVVEILVNPKGAVQKAVVIESQSHSDDCLWRVAVDAAGRSRFNEKASAPSLQRGTITYHFVKQ